MIIPWHRLRSGSILLLSVMGANFLNFVFNAVLGRWLSFEQFGVVTLVITFYYLSSLVTNALSATVNFQTATLLADNHEQEARQFFVWIVRRSMLFALIAVVVWMALIPLLQHFFQIASIWPLISFVPVIVLSVVTYVCVGYLQGSLQFAKAGAVVLTEPLMKVVAGVGLTLFGLGTVVYWSLSFSLLFAAIVALMVSMPGITGLLTGIQKSSIKTKSTITSTVFERTFFITTLTTGLSSVLFFSIDILLVKHFFSAELTGQYAILSLIGKMLFFFATIFNVFTLPIIARTKDRAKTYRLFTALLGVTALLASIGWLVVGAAGYLTVPLLFGAKTLQISHLLPWYTLGIAAYAVSSVVIAFHVARREYYFAIVSVAGSLLFGVLIFFNHMDLLQMVRNMCSTGVLLLLSVTMLHVFLLAQERAHDNAG